MQRTLIHAAAVADATGAWSPGAVLLDGMRILATGSPESVGTPADARLVERPRAAVMPALVNVHAHLDLTHLGPTPYGGDFASWAGRVRDERATTDGAIADSVRRGVALSRAGGTALVGDIAGSWSTVPPGVLRETGLGGVSFVEVFGIGGRQREAAARMRSVLEGVEADRDGVRVGVQPHAPYSCGLEIYRAAAALRRPLATHLAETLEELTFVASAEGPLADMLRALGAWDDEVRPTGRHPVDHLEPILGTAPAVIAHLNYVDDVHLEKLARWPITVAYCPRASEYFGHPHGEKPHHRYADMIRAGVDVALGTDSLVCLDTPDRISVLDDMRRLYRRDGTAPGLLLRMATIAGASGLGFDPALVTLAPGPCAGVIAVPSDDDTDPLAGAMHGREPPEWLIGPVPSTML